MLIIHFGMRRFLGSIMQTAFLVQIAVVSLIMWSFSLYNGLDEILTGRGVLGPVDWTRLAGSQKMTPQVHLAFLIWHM